MFEGTVNFAHRGGAALSPENTLESFRAGLAAGADRLEMDARVTADGAVVVIHDATVDRTTNGGGPVAGLSLAELKRLDAGYRFQRAGEFPFRGGGLSIPMLAEVYREFPQTPVNVEIKSTRPGDESRVYEEIRANAAEERTLVAAADHATLERFRAVADGTVPTAASQREIQTFFLASRAGLQATLDPRYSALQVPETYSGLNILTPRFLAAARAHGLRVDVWTVDDPADMRRLRNLGVDGIMTDRPDLLSEVLSEE